MNILTKRYAKNIRFYLLGVLIAVELLMSFSFLGYIHVEPISITTAYIPVLLAGALIGLPESILLGAVFGLASMWKASAHYVMPFDQLFSPVMSGFPLESLLLSVGSRMAFGLVMGLLYLAARRIRFTGLWIYIISFFGRVIHSLLVYGAMGFLFPETGYNASRALQGIASVNDLVTNFIIAGIVLLFWLMEKSRIWQDFRSRIEKAQRFQAGEHYHWLSLVLAILLTICLAMAVAVYFVHRMDYVLNQSGIILGEADYSDLIHLQIQFLIGILAMMILVIIFLIFNRRYATYMNYEAKMDALTGVMTRKPFFQTCRNLLDTLSASEEGMRYFIMIDVDRFKEVNDHYGHPEGDRILKLIAEQLRYTFGLDGVIGRVGGDEFAVLLYVPMHRGKLENILQLFMERVHEVGVGEHRMSCSMGVHSVTDFKTPDELYQEADRLLYKAKKQGRDQYVISASQAIPSDDLSAN